MELFGMKPLLFKIFSAVVLFHTSALAGGVVRIAIGGNDSDVCAATAGPIVRELKLLEKFLPRDGAYRNVTYDIRWCNSLTDEQLSDELLCGSVDIVAMADFSSVVAHAALRGQNRGVRTVYVAPLSSGLRGEGNALLVPLGSPVQGIKDLKGKTISVPFGSTAHAFLLRAVAEQRWDPVTDVAIISQAPAVGAMALKLKLIDAHASFAPFGELLQYRGIARKILDGESTGVPSTHGVQVRSDFAERHPEVVVAFLKATLEADRLVSANPEVLSEQYEKWTGVEAEVFYAYHGPHGLLIRDFTLKPEILAALGTAARTLKFLRKGKYRFDVKEFVDDKYIRQAARELGQNYESRLKSYAPNSFAAKDLFVGSEGVER